MTALSERQQPKPKATEAFTRRVYLFNVNRQAGKFTPGGLGHRWPALKLFTLHRVISITLYIAWSELSNAARKKTVVSFQKKIDKIHPPELPLQNLSPKRPK